MTIFQKSIIFKGKCVAPFGYFKPKNNRQLGIGSNQLIFWNQNDIFEYVILETEGYEHPGYFNTHRVLIDGYWLPLPETEFNMLFIDIAKWREKQIDSILND